MLSLAKHKNRRKKARWIVLGWRWLVLIPLLFYLVIGPVPFLALRDSITALVQEPKIVNSYSTSCSGEWQNAQGAKGVPELSEDAAFDLFSDANSAVYTGGPVNLTCGGFQEEENKVAVKKGFGIFWGKRTIAAPPPESPAASEATAPDAASVPETPVADVAAETPAEPAPQVALDAPRTEQSPETPEVTLDAPSSDAPVSAENQPETVQLDETSASGSETFTPSQTIILNPEIASAPEEPAETPAEIPFSSQNDEQVESATILLSFAMGDKANEFAPVSVTLAPKKTTKNSIWSNIGRIFQSRIVHAEEGSTTASQEVPAIAPAETFASSQVIFPAQETAAPLAETSETATSAEQNSGGGGPTPASASTALDAAATTLESLEQNLDTRIVVWYSLDGATWWKLGDLNSFPASNAINGGYLAFDAPFIKTAGDIKNLQIKLEGAWSGDQQVAAYLDSVWVKANYGGEGEAGKDISLLSKKDFKMGEDAGVRFRYKKQGYVLSLFGEALGLQDYWKNLKTTFRVVDPDGNEIGRSSIGDDAHEKTEEKFSLKLLRQGEVSVQFPAAKYFKPGKYKIFMTVEDDSDSRIIAQTYEQDFTLGVLAVNANKSIYLPKEQAYLQMAALTDSGRTLCSANLNLEVIAPDGKTQIFSTNPETASSTPTAANNLRGKRLTWSNVAFAEGEAAASSTESASAPAPEETPAPGDINLPENSSPEAPAASDAAPEPALAEAELDSAPIAPSVDAASSTEPTPAAEEIIISETASSIESAIEPFAADASSSQSLPEIGLELQPSAEGGAVASSKEPALAETGASSTESAPQQMQQTTIGKIEMSGACTGDNYTEKPDYFTYYQTGGAGTYQIKFSNVDTGAEISDAFEVRDWVPFDVERIGPTRIFPPSTYKVTLKIKANQDFVGDIIEKVPADFVIRDIQPSEGSVGEASKWFQGNLANPQTREIGWAANLRQGDQVELSYKFKAPNVSPYLYLLGPLRFENADPVMGAVEKIVDFLKNIFRSPFSGSQFVVGEAGSDPTLNGGGGGESRVSGVRPHLRGGGEPAGEPGEAGLSLAKPEVGSDPATAGTREVQFSEVFREARQWSIAADDTTGLKPCTSFVDGGWVDETNACGASPDDGAYATLTGTTGTSTWTTFGFSIPADSGINAISVRVQCTSNQVQGNRGDLTNIELSWDGGTSWTTTGRSQANCAASDTNYDFPDTTGDLWGRGGWSISELSDANFQVRIRGDASEKATIALKIDAIWVNVTYSPPSDNAPTVWDYSADTPDPVAQNQTLTFSVGWQDIEAGGSWTQATANAQWAARSHFPSVVFPAPGGASQAMWIIGGSPSKNDVWYSTNGITWTQQTSAAQWAARYNHTSVVFPAPSGTSQAVWVIGGTGAATYNDVWYSTNGITWTQQTSAAQWTARRIHTSVVFNGLGSSTSSQMWVIGGYDPALVATVNDVWYSTNGITWTQQTSAAQWTARYAHNTVVFDNRMWVIGGNVVGSPNNNVWYSSNGITWTQATSAAQWKARDTQVSLVFSNRIWMLAGFVSPANCNGSNYCNDVWYSTNGITWTQQTSAAQWTGRSYIAASVFNNQMWVIGGTTGSVINDVWYSDGEAAYAHFCKTAVMNSPTTGGSCTGGTWYSSASAASTSPLTGTYTPTSTVVGTQPYFAYVCSDGGQATSCSATTTILGASWEDAGARNDGTGSTNPAEWVARYNHTSLVFNGLGSSTSSQMWVIGGYTSTSTNDVWYSTNGITWTQATTNAQWVKRYGHTSVVFNDPSTGSGQAVWVMGGKTNSTIEYNDVWYSSNGIAWTQATANAQWFERSNFTSLVYNNRMWIMGSPNTINDVWYSDNGTTWTRATANAQWPGRYYHKSVVFNNLMWLFGGDSLGVNVNDVWYSGNGTTWTKATTNAQWVARYSLSPLVYDNKIWVIGGCTAGGCTTSQNDVWYSSNGTTWTKATTNAQWVARLGGDALVFDNQMWVIGGWTSGVTNDVWRTPPAGTFYVNASPQVTSVADSPADTAVDVDSDITFTVGWDDANIFYPPEAGEGISEFSPAQEASKTDLGARWSVGTLNAQWIIRDEHTSVIFNVPGGSQQAVWVIGGGYNDVWYSTNGTTWTQATAAAQWEAMDEHTSLVFNGIGSSTSSQMWVIGGKPSGNELNTVWYSTNGTTWTQATTNAQWGARSQHTSVVFDNKMWVAGGCYLSTCYNDVWYSTNGTTWTKATTNAQWGTRRDHTSVVFNNRMWVIGGTVAGAVNDVWYSTNGIAWTQATSAAQWAARIWHTSVVLYNPSARAEAIWVLGGSLNNDVWYSVNGVSWTSATGNARWTGRQDSASVVFNNQIWVIGGCSGASCLTFNNDVWYSDTEAVKSKLHICKTNAIDSPSTGGNCTGGSWADATSFSSAGTQTATRTATTSDVGTNDYWVFSCDDKGATNSCSSTTTGIGDYWTQARSNADWAARYDHTSVAFNSTTPSASGTQLWAIGGWNGTSYYNDVWYTNNGTTWTQQTSAAQWTARYSHTSLVFNSQMWVIGGVTSATSTNDVWYSDNATTWTKATTNAQWTARYDHSSIVFNSQIWVIGGWNGTTRYNDVWLSDNGVTWTQKTTAAQWGARNGQTSLVFNSQMWVIGGTTGSVQNDVWYSDNGTTWTTSTAAAQWSARNSQGSAVFNSQMWVIGGTTGTNQNDVWYSGNGTTWTSATTAALWTARNAQASVLFDNKMWVMGGGVSGGGSDSQGTGGTITTAGNNQATRFNQRSILKNPRGLNAWYAIVQNSTGGSAGLRMFSSTSGTAWRDEGQLNSSTIMGADAFGYDDGSQFIMYAAYAGNDAARTQTALYYRYITVADATSTPVIGGENTVDAGAQNVYPCITRDRNGYVLIAYNDTGFTPDNFVAVGSTAANPGASPTWSGQGLLAGTKEPGHCEFVNFSSGDIAGFVAGTRQDGTNQSISTVDIESFDGTTFATGTLFQIANSGSATFADWPWSMVVDSSDTAHIIYESTPLGGGKIVSQKASAVSTVESWSASTTIDTNDPDTLSLSINRTASPNKLYAFYQYGTATLRYRTTPVDTISWGSESTFTESSDFNYVTTSRRDEDGTLSIMYTASTTFGVQFQYLTLGSGTASGNNDVWYSPRNTGTFTVASAAGLDISGRACTAEPCTGTNGSTACSVASVVGLSVEGAAPSFASCNTTTGAYAFTGVSISSGQVATLFLNDNAADASAVVKVASSDITGLDFYENTVVVRAETGTVGTTEMAKYDSDDQANDIRFQAQASASTTLESGQELHVWTGDTFDPNGKVTTATNGGDFHVDDSATAYLDTATSVIGLDILVDSGATLSISADVDVNGGDIVTSGTSPTISYTTTPTLTLTGEGAIGGGTTPSITFYNVILGATATTTASSTMTIDNDLTINGLLQGSNTATTTVKGNIAGTGRVNMTGGTIEQRVGAAKNFGTTSGSNDWTFNNLGFSDSGASGYTITTQGGTGAMNVGGVLFVGLAGDTASTTLNAGTRTWTLSGTGTPFSLSSTRGNFTASTSTFNYTGTAAAVNVTPTIYYNLGVGTTGDGNSVTYTVTGNATTTKTFTVGASSGAGTHTFNASAYTMNLSGTGTPFVIASQGAFTASTSTISYTGNGATNITATGTYYTLNIGSAGLTASTTYTALGNITATNQINLQSADSGEVNTFDASGFNLTVGSSSVANSGGIAVPIRSTLTQTASGNTIVYSSSGGAATIGGAGTTTLYNLKIGASLDNISYTFTLGGTLTVSNNLYVAAGGTGTHTFDVSSTNYGVTVGGNWDNNSAFTRRGGTVTFTATTTGKTISDNGYAFYDMSFSGSGGGWTYTDEGTVNGSSTNSTTLTAGTATFINARTGTLSVSGATLNSDWYLGIHLVDGTATSTDVATFSAAGKSWTQATSAAQWGARRTHVSVVFNSPSGTPAMWVIGGFTTVNVNDVWYSGNGTTWTQTTAAAQWAARRSYTSLIFNSPAGESAMWAIGGWDGTTRYNDVWYSTNGTTWTQQTATAGWAARLALTSLVFNNQMWVIGGCSAGGCTTYQNDVWYSDDGTTWTQATVNAQWIARYSHASVVFPAPGGGGQAMWVNGGFTGSFANDVWYSTNGVTWTQATVNAQWAARQYHSSVVFSNVMWVLGGNGGNNNEVWYSANGTTWTQQTANAPWGQYGHTSPVFNNQMWVIGGVDGGNHNDVWSSQGDNKVTVSENTGSSTVFWHNGTGWESGATSETTDTTASGTNPSPEYAGAIKVREYSMTNSATCPGAGCALYKYNLATDWVLVGSTNYGPYDYYNDYGKNYLSSCLGGASTTCSDSAQGAEWTQATAAAQWAGRSDSSSVVFNNQMWVVGGFTSTSTNDVWYSGNGTTWTQATAAAQWDGRRQHTSLVFNNQLWVIGGWRGAGITNDVWYSGNGIVWTQATSAAQWVARRIHTSLVFNNQMWVIGGLAGGTACSGVAYCNDVWYSGNGTTWTQATTNAQWPGRYSPTSLVFNNQMWVIGGTREGSTNYNDVWYSDNGTTWTQQTAAAQWVARYQHTSLVFNNQMWVIGGLAPTRTNDVWYSTNGTTWTQATTNAQWVARYFHASLVLNNHMWVIGGYTTAAQNDVWYLASSDDVIGSLWHRATPGSVNGAKDYDGLNSPPLNGTLYAGLLSGLTVSLSNTTVDLGELNTANSFTASSATTSITVTTSASTGYIATAWATNAGRLKLQSVETYLDAWTGTNGVPTNWNGNCPSNSECGFGYTTNDGVLSGGGGEDRFVATTGACGADNLCWAGFATEGPGDPVADSTGPTISQQNVVTYKVSSSATQASGQYQTTVVYVVTAQY